MANGTLEQGARDLLESGVFPDFSEETSRFAEERRQLGQQLQQQIALGNQPEKRGLVDKIIPIANAIGLLIDATGRKRGVRESAAGKSLAISQAGVERRQQSRQEKRQRTLDAIAGLELGGKFSAQAFEALQQGSIRKGERVKTAIRATVAEKQLKADKRGFDKAADAAKKEEAAEKRSTALTVAGRDTWTDDDFLFMTERHNRDFPTVDEAFRTARKEIDDAVNKEILKKILSLDSPDEDTIKGILAFGEMEKERRYEEEEVSAPEIPQLAEPLQRPDILGVRTGTVPQAPVDIEDILRFTAPEQGQDYRNILEQLGQEVTPLR